MKNKKKSNGRYPLLLTDSEKKTAKTNNLVQIWKIGKGK